MSTFARATLVALLAIASIAFTSVAEAASGPNITVQIEGEEATVVEQREVVLDYNKFSPPAPWPGTSAPANSIGAAIETALKDTYGPPPTNGWWDREPFVSEVKGETLIWPKYWAFFTNNIYVNKGAMDGGDRWGLDYGDDLLISGGGSIGEWPEPSRPERLPVDLAGTGIDDGAEAVPVNAPFPVEVTAWMPQEGDTDMPPGPSDRQRGSDPIPGEDFTVVGLPTETLYDRNTVGSIDLGAAKTNAEGKAELAIDRPGEALIKAVREDAGAPFGASSLGAQGRSEAHRICVYELNSGACGTPVFTPAESIDVGPAAVNGIGSPKALKVASPSGPNTVTGVRVSGPDAADFIVSAGNCVDERIGQGESCPISVRLAPTAVGHREATLRVKSDSESLPRDIALSGTGSTGPAPSGNARLSLRVNPASTRIRRGGTAAVTVRTTNVGDAIATNLVSCLRLPQGFRAGRACGNRPRLAVGATAAFTFKVRATGQAPLGQFRNAEARSTADGIGVATGRLRLGARR